MAEPKELTYSFGKQEIYHNVLLQAFLLNATTCMPSQGNTDTSRNGDIIHVSGFSLKIMFGNKFDRPNVTYRIIIFEGQPGFVYNATTVLKAVSGNLLLDGVNTDLVKVKKQVFIKPQQSTLFAANASADTTKEYTFVRKFWIPVNKTYKFAADGGLLHNQKNLYCYIGAYDAFGTLTTDNIAYCQGWSTCYFRDP